MAASIEAKAEQCQVVDGLQAGRRAERERGGVIGLRLQRHAARTSGAGAVDNVLEQGTRDTTTVFRVAPTPADDSQARHLED